MDRAARKTEHQCETFSIDRLSLGLWIPNVTDGEKPNLESCLALLRPAVRVARPAALGIPVTLAPSTVQAAQVQGTTLVGTILVVPAPMVLGPRAQAREPDLAAQGMDPEDQDSDPVAQGKDLAAQGMDPEDQDSDLAAPGKDLAAPGPDLVAPETDLAALGKDQDLDPVALVTVASLGPVVPKGVAGILGEL